MSCSVAVGYQYFGITLKMEAAKHTSYHNTTQCYNPEDLDLNSFLMLSKASYFDTGHMLSQRVVIIEK
jgi:hypothetical protein